MTPPVRELTTGWSDTHPRVVSANRRSQPSVLPQMRRFWHESAIGAIMAGHTQHELTTGHDLLCTAAYDAEGVCHELEGCALVDWPATPPCTCRYGRAAVVLHLHALNRSLAAECFCAARVFWINPSCLHHGEGFRW